MSVKVEQSIKCNHCSSDLTLENAVCRTYHLPREKIIVGIGHYTEDGDFEPDVKIFGGMDGAQTYDGDDRCTVCNRVVG